MPGAALPAAGGAQAAGGPIARRGVELAAAVNTLYTEAPWLNP